MRWRPATRSKAPPPIVYTADIFDAEALDLCVERNIHVNCGSPDMIEHLGRRAPGRKVTLRINPGFGHGHSRKTNTGGDQSKHGIWHEQIGLCLEMAACHQIVVSGVHMHIGSGTDLEHLAQVCAAMEKAALAVGPTVTSISAGGGLPTIYRPGDEYVNLAAYFTRWDAAQAVGRPLWPQPRFGDRAGPLPGGRERLLGGRDPRGQAAGRALVLSVGRRFQQSGPADPLRLLSSHVDRAPRRCTAAGSRGDRGRSVVRVG